MFLKKKGHAIENITLRFVLIAAVLAAALEAFGGRQLSFTRGLRSVDCHTSSRQLSQPEVCHSDLAHPFY